MRLPSSSFPSGFPRWSGCRGGRRGGAALGGPGHGGRKEARWWPGTEGREVVAAADGDEGGSARWDSGTELRGARGGDGNGREGRGGRGARGGDGEVGRGGGRRGQPEAAGRRRREVRAWGRWSGRAGPVRPEQLIRVRP